MKKQNALTMNRAIGILFVAMAFALAGCGRGAQFSGTTQSTPDLTPRLNALQALLNLNFTQDSLLLARVDALDARIANAETSIMGLQWTVAANQSALQAEIDSLTSSNSLLAAQATSMLAQIQALNANGASASALAALAATVSVVQAGLNTTNGNVTALQASVATINTQVAGLQAGQASLNTSIAGIQSQINSLNVNFNTLSAQYSTSYNQLTAGLNQVTSNVATLTSSINALTAQTNTNTSNIAAQVAQLSTLQVQMATANANIGSLQTLVAQLQGKTVEIVNTCGSEKLERINGKLYGVYHTVTTTTATIAQLGSNTVTVANCTIENSGNNGNGNGPKKCVGDLTQTVIPVPTSGTLTYINSVASYWSEIPNGTYVTTDTTNNAGGTGCRFTVLNGQVSF
jgi:predicted  nucleic acid-binding Zn-ribbon protein